MANNRKTTRGRKNQIQIIYSEPQWILKERYLSPKGKKLLDKLQTMYESLKDNGYIQSSIQIWNKYGKNRYQLNPNAKLIKIIVHNI